MHCIWVCACMQGLVMVTCAIVQFSEILQGVSRANYLRANRIFHGAIKCMEKEQKGHWGSSELGEKWFNISYVDTVTDLYVKS